MLLEGYQCIGGICVVSACVADDLKLFFYQAMLKEV